MTKRAKKFSNPQACGPELTDDELERAVGGIAAVAPNANTLDATSRQPVPAPPEPAPASGQSLGGGAAADFRSIAASNSIENPRKAGPLLRLGTTSRCG
jgi:hypothetical protein